MLHKHIGKGNVVSKMGDVPLMSNPADLCRECELSGRNKELERQLSEMAIEVVALTEENRVLKLRLKEE
ncbi:MAG: hypothetical protein EOM62_21870 [Bacteroidia bacterium]|nr:hypothetical protein [Bacteroidia bacterium]